MQGDPEAGRMLEAIRAKHGVPALGGAVLNAQGLQVAAVTGVRKAGYPTAVTLQDRWHLGSDTKALTAALLAVLVEQGKLQWDTPLAAIFPGLLNPHPVASVTLRQLITHRAGVPATAPWAALAPEGTLSEKRRAAVAWLNTTPLRSAPGATYAYSNLGFVVAGAIAEALTHQPYEEAMRALVLAPLGMRDVGYGWAGTAGETDQPWGHRTDGRPVQFDNPLMIAPAGGMHCPLADWAKFVGDQLHGAAGHAGLLKPETYRDLLRPQGTETYAGGWGVVDQPWGNGKILTHSGSNTFNMAMATVAPGRDIAILVVCNQGGTEKACQEAVAALLKGYLKPKP